MDNIDNKMNPCYYISTKSQIKQFFQTNKNLKLDYGMVI